MKRVTTNPNSASLEMSSAQRRPPVPQRLAIPDTATEPSAKRVSLESLPFLSQPTKPTMINEKDAHYFEQLQDAYLLLPPGVEREMRVLILLLSLRLVPLYQDGVDAPIGTVSTIGIKLPNQRKPLLMGTNPESIIKNSKILLRLLELEGRQALLEKLHRQCPLLLRAADEKHSEYPALRKAFEDPGTVEQYKTILKRLLEEEVSPLYLARLNRFRMQAVHLKDEVRGKNVLVVVGLSGVGKTTLLHAVEGATIESGADGELRVMESNSALKDRFTIRGGPVSETEDVALVLLRRSTAPGVEGLKVKMDDKTSSWSTLSKLSDKDAVYLCDTPGLSDTGNAAKARDPIVTRIFNSQCIAEALQAAASLRVMVVFSVNSYGTRAANFLEQVKAIATLFPIVETTCEGFFYVFTGYSQEITPKRILIDIEQIISGREIAITPAVRRLLTDIKKKFFMEQKKGYAIFRPGMPGSQEPAVLLEPLLAQAPIMDPGAAVRAFVEDTCELKLKEQVTLHCRTIERIAGLLRAYPQTKRYSAQELKTLLATVTHTFSDLALLSKILPDLDISECLINWLKMVKEKHASAMAVFLQPAQNPLPSEAFLESVMRDIVFLSDCEALMGVAGSKLLDRACQTVRRVVPPQVEAAGPLHQQFFESIPGARFSLETVTDYCKKLRGTLDDLLDLERARLEFRLADRVKSFQSPEEERKTSAEDARGKGRVFADAEGEGVVRFPALRWTPQEAPSLKRYECGLRALLGWGKSFADLCRDQEETQGRVEELQAKFGGVSSEEMLPVLLNNLRTLVTVMPSFAQQGAVHKFSFSVFEKLHALAKAALGIEDYVSLAIIIDRFQVIFEHVKGALTYSLGYMSPEKTPAFGQFLVSTNYEFFLGLPAGSVPQGEKTQISASVPQEEKTQISAEHKPGQIRLLNFDYPEKLKKPGVSELAEKLAEKEKKEAKEAFLRRLAAKKAAGETLSADELKEEKLIEEASSAEKSAAEKLAAEKAAAKGLEYRVCHSDTKFDQDIITPAALKACFVAPYTSLEKKSDGAPPVHEVHLLPGSEDELDYFKDALSEQGREQLQEYLPPLFKMLAMHKQRFLQPPDRDWLHYIVRKVDGSLVMDTLSKAELERCLGGGSANYAAFSAAKKIDLSRISLGDAIDRVRPVLGKRLGYSFDAFVETLEEEGARQGINFRAESVVNSVVFALLRRKLKNNTEVFLSTLEGAVLVSQLEPFTGHFLKIASERQHIHTEHDYQRTLAAMEGSFIKGLNKLVPSVPALLKEGEQGGLSTAQIKEIQYVIEIFQGLDENEEFEKFRKRRGWDPKRKSEGGEKNPVESCLQLIFELKSHFLSIYNQIEDFYKKEETALQQESDARGHFSLPLEPLDKLGNWITQMQAIGGLEKLSSTAKWIPVYYNGACEKVLALVMGPITRWEVLAPSTSTAVFTADLYFKINTYLNFFKSEDRAAWMIPQLRKEVSERVQRWLERRAVFLQEGHEPYPAPPLQASHMRYIERHHERIKEIEFLLSQVPEEALPRSLRDSLEAIKDGFYKKIQEMLTRTANRYERYSSKVSIPEVLYTEVMPYIACCRQKKIEESSFIATERQIFAFLDRRTAVLEEQFFADFDLIIKKTKKRMQPSHQSESLEREVKEPLERLLSSLKEMKNFKAVFPDTSRIDCSSWEEWVKRLTTLLETLGGLFRDSVKEATVDGDEKQERRSTTWMPLLQLCKAFFPLDDYLPAPESFAEETTTLETVKTFRQLYALCHRLLQDELLPVVRNILAHFKRKDYERVVEESERDLGPGVPGRASLQEYIKEGVEQRMATLAHYRRALFRYQGGDEREQPVFFDMKAFVRTYQDLQQMRCLVAVEAGLLPSEEAQEAYGDCLSRAERDAHHWFKDCIARINRQIEDLNFLEAARAIKKLQETVSTLGTLQPREAAAMLQENDRSLKQRKESILLLFQQPLEPGCREQFQKMNGHFRRVAFSNDSTGLQGEYEKYWITLLRALLQTMKNEPLRILSAYEASEMNEEAVCLAIDRIASFFIKGSVVEEGSGTWLAFVLKAGAGVRSDLVLWQQNEIEGASPALRARQYGVHIFNGLKEKIRGRTDLSGEVERIEKLCVLLKWESALTGLFSERELDFASVIRLVRVQMESLLEKIKGALKGNSFPAEMLMDLMKIYNKAKDTSLASFVDYIFCGCAEAVADFYGDIIKSIKENFEKIERNYGDEKCKKVVIDHFTMLCRIYLFYRSCLDEGLTEVSKLFLRFPEEFSQCISWCTEFSGRKRVFFARALEEKNVASLSSALAFANAWAPVAEAMNDNIQTLKMGIKDSSPTSDQVLEGLRQQLQQGWAAVFVQEIAQALHKIIDTLRQTATLRALRSSSDTGTEARKRYFSELRGNFSFLEEAATLRDAMPSGEALGARSLELLKEGKERVLRYLQSLYAEVCSALPPDEEAEVALLGAEKDWEAFQRAYKELEAFTSVCEGTTSLGHFQLASVQGAEMQMVLATRVAEHLKKRFGALTGTLFVKYQKRVEESRFAREDDSAREDGLAREDGPVREEGFPRVRGAKLRTEIVNFLIGMQKIRNTLPMFSSILRTKITEFLQFIQQVYERDGRAYLQWIAQELQNDQTGVGGSLISEQPCFEGGVIFKRNLSTAAQDINYVLKGMEEEKGSGRIGPLTEPAKARLLKAYKDYQEEYDRLLARYISPELDFDKNRETHLAGLRDAVRELVSTSSLQQEDGKIVWDARAIDLVPRLIAHLFVCWTLRDSRAFFDQTFAEAQDRNNYLKRPHAAQILAIFRILNVAVEEGEVQDLENHFVQVLSGEGKSIVIAVLAIVLALFGFTVSVACYSNYLVTRDYNDFKEMFSFFGIEKTLIRYGTLNQLLEQVLNEECDLREQVSVTVETLRPDQISDSVAAAGPRMFASAVEGMAQAVREVVKGSAMASTRRPTAEVETVMAKNSKNHVFIGDEVDTLYHKKIYGSSYSPYTLVQADCISALLDFIWQQHRAPQGSLTLELVKGSAPYRACAARYSVWIPLLDAELVEMLGDLQGYKQSPQHPYRIDAQGNVTYPYGDGRVIMRLGYKTLWALYYEHHLGTITTEALQRQQGLMVEGGVFSYTTMLTENRFRCLIGVTGTLREMSTPEQEIVRGEFRIQKQTFLPSIYGPNNLTFNKGVDVVVVEDALYFNKLAAHIAQRLVGHSVDAQRAVIVFFDDMEALQKCYDAPEMRSLRSQISLMTNESSSTVEEQEAEIRKATRSGAITFALKSFARGRDSICLDPRVISSGGMHIIWTLLPLLLADQNQGFYRGPRGGLPGSGSLFLKEEELIKTYGITKADIESWRSRGTLYDELHKARAVTFEKTFRQLTKAIKEVLNPVHKDSMELRTKLIKLYQRGGIEQLSISDLKRIKELLIKLNPQPMPRYKASRSRLLIMIDATGSMATFLNAVKALTGTLIRALCNMRDKNGLAAGIFALKILCYRNYNCTPDGPDGLCYVSRWSSDPEVLVSFLKPIQPNGGLGAEAIEVGLYHVNALLRAGKFEDMPTKVLIIGDREPNSKRTFAGNRSDYGYGYAKERRKYSSEARYYEEELSDLVRLGGGKVHCHTYQIKGGIAEDADTERHFRYIASETKGTFQVLNLKSATAEADVTTIFGRHIVEEIASGDAAMSSKLWSDFQVGAFSKGGGV